MVLWYGLDGQPIDMFAAEALLHDELARRVAHTTLYTAKGTITVSTVFMVLDQNHSGVGPPVLWETMAFGGPVDMDQRRYSSRVDAEEGHAEMVSWVRSALDSEGTKVISEDVFIGSSESGS